MVEIESTVAVVKNTFDGAISRTEPEKRISEPENTFLELPNQKHKRKIGTQEGKDRTEHPRTMGTTSNILINTQLES